MVLFLCTILIILLCIIKKKSRIIFAFAITWLWILMAFSSGNADESINIWRYTNYMQTTGMTEKGYYYIMDFFVSRGVSYQIYKCVIAAIELTLIGSTIYKMSKFPNLVLAMYSIFPFCMDVVQMRNTLAISIVIFSFRFLDNKTSDIGATNKIATKNTVLFCLLVALAMYFHLVSGVFFIFLLAKKLDIKKLFISILSILFIESIILTPTLFSRIGVMFGMDAKVASVLGEFSNNIKMLPLYYLRMAVFFLCIILMLFVIKYVQKSEHNQKKYMIKLLKYNMAILIIIPLMVYSVDFYRCQNMLSIFNYITVSNMLKNERRGRASLINIVIILCLIVISMVNLYLLVLSNNNINTVFWPLFKNNTLLP